MSNSQPQTTNLSPLHEWLNDSIAPQTKAKGITQAFMKQTFNGVTIEQMREQELLEASKRLAEQTMHLSEEELDRAMAGLAAESAAQPQYEEPTLQNPTLDQGIFAGLAAALFPKSAGQIAALPFLAQIARHDKDIKVALTAFQDEGRNNHERLLAAQTLVGIAKSRHSNALDQYTRLVIESARQQRDREAEALRAGLHDKQVRDSLDLERIKQTGRDTDAALRAQGRTKSADAALHKEWANDMQSAIRSGDVATAMYWGHKLEAASQLSRDRLLELKADAVLNREERETARRDKAQSGRRAQNLAANRFRSEFSPGERAFDPFGDPATTVIPERKPAADVNAKRKALQAVDREIEALRTKLSADRQSQKAAVENAPKMADYPDQAAFESAREGAALKVSQTATRIASYEKQIEKLVKLKREYLRRSSKWFEAVRLSPPPAPIERTLAPH